MNKKVWLYAGIAGLFFGAAAYMFLNRAADNLLMKFVPNDANLVVKINVPEIATILSSENKQLKELRLLSSDSAWNENQLLRLCYKFMKDPDGSGIDFSSNAYYFSQTLMRGEVQGFALKLSNESTFAEYVKKNSPVGSESGETESVNFSEYSTGLFISWYDDIALITNQITEEKSYFIDILKQKNPSAKGNLMAKELNENKGLVSGYINMKSIKNGVFKNTAGTEFAMLSGIADIMFNDGIFAMFTIAADKGTANVEIWLQAADKKKLEKLDLFGTPDPKLAKFPVFYKYTPQSQFYLSLNLNKTLEFIMKESPEMKELLAENKELNSLIDAFTGNIYSGVTMNEPMMQSLLSSDGTFDFSAAEPLNVMVIHVGIKKNIDALISQYSAFLKELEPGVYQTAFGYYLRIYSDHISIANNKEAILALTDSKGYKNESIASEFNSLVANSPFILISDNSKINSAFKNEPTSIEYLLNYSMGKQVLSTHKNKFTWKIELENNKEHILISLVKMLDKVYQSNLSEATDVMNTRAAQEVEF